MAPPTNDNFSSATTLSTSLPNSLASQTTFEATRETDEWNSNLPAATYPEQSVWYSFTPTTSGVHKFTLANPVLHGNSPSYIQGALQVYTGTALNNLVFHHGYQYDSLYMSGDEDFYAPLIASTAYSIRVSSPSQYDGVQNKHTFDFDLDWSYIAARSAPANDTWANRIALSTSLPGSRANDTTVDSWDQTDQPNFAAYQRSVQDVWYSFTPTSTGKYDFEFTNRTYEGHRFSSDARLSVTLFTGASVNALTYVNSQQIVWNNVSSPRPKARFQLQSGVAYTIRVNSGAYPYGQFNVNVMEYDLGWNAFTDSGSAPANDNLANAIDLGTDPAIVQAGTTIYATNEAWEIASSYDDSPSVWYKFTAGSSYNIDFEVTRTAGGDTQFEPYVEVYEALVGSPADFDDLNYIESIDYNDGVIPVPIENGKTYYVYVLDNFFNNMWGNFDLAIGPTPPPPPSNDDLSSINSYNQANQLDKSEYGAWSAQKLAGQLEGTTISATSEVGEAAHGGYGPTRSAWYRLFIYNYQEYVNTIRIWVESAVDCVLSVYDDVGANDFATIVSVGEDDDSGAGNWPQVDVPGNKFSDYIIAVDSKTPGNFTLKFKQLSTGSPPANDDWANAVAFTAPGANVVNGTTVAATAEPAEREHWNDNIGPTDSVWYKYTPTHDGTLRVRGSCNTDNYDGYCLVDIWRGTTLDNLVRINGQYGYPAAEWWYYGDTIDSQWAEMRVKVLVADDPYYIRVQTPSGGSEDFTVWIDEDAVFLKLTPSAAEDFHIAHPEDDAEVYLDIRITSLDAGPTDEVGTVPLTITPITTYEAQGVEHTDSASIALTLTPLGGECYSRFHFTGEGEADARWNPTSNLTRWLADEQQNWVAFIEIQPAC